MNLQLDKGSYYGDLFLYIILSRGREFRRRDFAFRPAKSLSLSRLKTRFRLPSLTRDFAFSTCEVAHA